MITPVAPQPSLFGPFGVRLPTTAAKLLARLRRPGLLWLAALLATYAAVGAASTALASQLTSNGGSVATAGVRKSCVHVLGELRRPYGQQGNSVVGDSSGVKQMSARIDTHT